MKPDETNQLVRLQACLKESWMSQNFLLVNSDKTEVIIFGPERFRKKLTSYIDTLDGISLVSSSAVRNLGVISDQDSVSYLTYKTGFWDSLFSPS